MDLSRYYSEICKTPLLTREEEFDLFMELGDPAISEKEKNKIKDKIIKGNLRFVFKTAKKFSKNDPDVFEELILAGNEGLLVGLEKFKPAMNVRFLSYAGWWIQQRILKEMSKMRIVSLPIWKQQVLARIQKYVESKEEDVTFDELKKEFPEIREKDLRELYSTKYLTYYLDDITDDPSFEIDPIGTEVEVRMDRDKIHNIISKLPSPHREIIELTYGINDGEEMTNTNVAKQLNLSKEQFREYKKEALSILRQQLGGSL
jgi:RNA polymerase sigma factor (sigma-70 family)